MKKTLSCTNCGSQDFMPVVRMQQGENHSLSHPYSCWTGVKCSSCGAYLSGEEISPFIRTSRFK